VPPPAHCVAFFPAGAGPRFAANFDMRLAAGARPMSGGEPAFALWVRHRDAGAANPLAALVALADALPPAAMVAFARPAPISTMTWALDLLSAPDDGAGAWRLLRSASEHAADGYSVQAMMLWDERGRPLCLGRQTVALFA
jgi:acyl-CoA thioesterase